jgi:hypothetical protein
MTRVEFGSMKLRKNNRIRFQCLDEVNSETEGRNCGLKEQIILSFVARINIHLNCNSINTKEVAKEREEQ